MPQRSNIVGDLGTTKIASDSYDIDNIYLTEEGWVYRHYKRADQSKWWDEIIVAGQVIPADNAPCEETNPPKLGTHGVDGGEPAPTFEGSVTGASGDTIEDYLYSPLYDENSDPAADKSDLVLGGGVPFDDVRDGTTTTTTSLIGTVDLVGGGTGYSVASGVQLTGGSGTGAEITITAISDDGNSTITAFSITERGSGYVNGETLTVDAGDGNATVTITSLFQY